MSTAVTSLISLGVMLIITFTALGSVFTLQDRTADAGSAQLEQILLAVRSDVRAAAAATSTRLDGHSDVDITVANRGSLTYALFTQWDVTAHYTHIDGTNEGLRLPYVTSLEDDSWTVEGIYLDAAASVPEVLEPGVLNPGEEAVLRVRLAPPAEPGATGWVVVTPPEGPPTGVSFANPASLYVVDADLTVYLYATDGTYQGSYPLDPENTGPGGITTHARSFYVPDGYDDATYRYAAGFSLQETWPHTTGHGSSDGITTDGVSIWIVDRQDDVVYKYDMNGAFISQTRLHGNNASARGITTDGTYIWVADGADDSVYKYDMNLAFISELPLATGNTTPRGITTDGDRIWVVDDDDNAVYTYDMNMNYLSQFSLASGNSSPAGVTVAPR